MQNDIDNDEEIPLVQIDIDNDEETPLLQIDIDNDEETPLVQIDIDNDEETPLVQIDIDNDEETPLVQNDIDNDEEIPLVQIDIDNDEETPLVQNNGESLDILTIDVLPQVELITEFGQQGIKRLRSFGNMLVVLFIVIVYLVACLAYIVNKQHHIAEEKGSEIWIWVINILIPIVMYIFGIIVINIPSRCLCCKKCKLAAILLCLFLSVTAISLLLETLFLTVIGTVINIGFVQPFWVAAVGGCYFVVKTLQDFFDEYQNLFKNVHSIGTKIDRENTKYKIFSYKCNCSTEVTECHICCEDSPLRISDKSYAISETGYLESGPNKKTIYTKYNTQIKCFIKFDVLKNIIKDQLPFGKHVKKLGIGLIILISVIGVVSLVIVFIDGKSAFSRIMEYVFALIPLGIAVKGKIARDPCSPPGKIKNRSQHDLHTLEEKLRDYAQSGRHFSKQTGPFW